MDIKNYKFSDDELKTLKIYRDNQKDSRLKIRFLTLIMLAQQIDINIISLTIGKSIETIENWFHLYITKGINSLNSFQYKSKETFLKEEQISQLIEWVKKTNPSKIKEVKLYIKEQFSVIYSIEAIRRLLHKRGLKVLRPKVVPGGAPSEEKQKKQVEKYFQIKSSSEPGTVILFVDGMHLIHQNIPGLCWGSPQNPPIIKTNTGRNRLNILGGYNPDNYSFLHLTGEENCDAKRVITFLTLVNEKYPVAPKVIIFLDNAKYFKAEIVTQWLNEHPQIQLEFLPTYAPNLNLIERFWRFVKEHLVKNEYYKKYKTFRAKVFQFLNHIEPHREELKSLMVEKFQIIHA